ncbi:hypothetical protein KP509_13G017100 [Ceratopteris richardii]|uniref:Citrate transporter-like domain-containing protein n=1 Tax=Ceratopteris richardii TaxID=49495 RepID=A0A8T2TFW6_CERRI|nr:hypothetical protein KP509_13G017100 [Ceratopteris richardii]
MALADTRTVILGSFAFVVFWVTATFPKFHALPIGRTAGALASAALVVVCHVESPDQAYASIDLPILGLLFGTMIVSVYLQRADLFKYLAKALSYRCRGGKDLLCRLSFLVAFTSALFTNDTCCVLFTEFILAFCKEKGLPPQPFLLALSTSSNIGSSATSIGNPQNLVIAIKSRISFGRFLVGMLPSMVIGISTNTALLLAVYWKQLSTVVIRKAEVEGEIFPHAIEIANVGNGNPVADIGNRREHDAMKPNLVVSLQRCRSNGVDNSGQSYHVSQNADIHEPSSDGSSSGSQVFVLQEASDNAEKKAVSEGSQQQVMNVAGESLEKHGTTVIQLDSPSSIPPLQSLPPSGLCLEEPKWKAWKSRVWELSVYLVTIGMLAALLAGLNLSWCTITAAVILIVLDFEDAGPYISKVSYSLLVFFSAMFITVDGFNRTGLPETFWKSVESHVRINRFLGTVLLAAVVVLLSNIASNVPTVLLLGPMVAAASRELPGASETKAWLILAWASTVAGNLTLVGSAANLIVCEQARMSRRMPYNLSFWKHLKFGFPSTLIVVIAGLPVIRG